MYSAYIHKHLINNQIPKNSHFRVGSLKKNASYDVYANKNNSIKINFVTIRNNTGEIFAINSRENFIHKAKRGNKQGKIESQLKSFYKTPADV